VLFLHLPLRRKESRRPGEGPEAGSDEGKKTMTRNEYDHYERQIRIFGRKGQERLKTAKVFVAGAGGLGAAICTYLVQAGIGTLRIVDKGRVERSNLNRQFLFGEEDIGTVKVEAAAAAISRMNPSVRVEALRETITKKNVFDLVGDCAIIVDAMDNYSARHVLNDAAWSLGIPFVHGAIEGFYGQVTTFIPGRTPCLRCLMPDAPPPRDLPIIGTFCGIIGSIEATETIKFFVGTGSLIENKLLMLDGMNSVVEEVALNGNPDCRICGRRRAGR